MNPIKDFTPQIIGTPLQEQPIWPDHRDVNAVFQLHEFNDEDTLK
jgi:hypothetical protein